MVKQIGKCDQRHSPFSTFKIPLALIGFDGGILNSSASPKVEYTPDLEKNYVTYYNPERYPVMLFWKRAQTPQSWMRESVVWYSRYITHKLGLQKFEEYMNRFDYGNYKDITFSADSLMNSWIMGSIEISPLEQVEFIDKLLNNQLNVSNKATQETIEIIKLEKIFDDWQLCGKSGGAIELG